MANPSDSSALAARIAQILDDEPLRRRMGTASRSRAVAEFDYDVLARRLGGVLGVDHHE
jgi:glycosyltransferase involved in cell wall biosynthesis